MNNPTLWVFGTSFCLPYNIDNDSNGWPSIVAKKLSFQYKNFAQPASDNFFIYHTYLENRQKIKSTDIVIIGWSHYNRKSFVLNSYNVSQQEVIEKSIVYTTDTKKLIRSINPVRGVNYFLNLKPLDRGVNYYDQWYRDYYSEYEQICNQQSYMDSVQLTCPAKYIPFFFSKESILNIDVGKFPADCIADFVKENNVEISNNDGHLNKHGHQLWAEQLMSRINDFSN
jgi:hypothetical protein